MTKTLIIILALTLLGTTLATPTQAATIRPAIIAPHYEWASIVTTSCRQWERMHVSRQAWRLTTFVAAMHGFDWDDKFDPDQDGVPCEWVVGWAKLPGHFWIPLNDGVTNYKLTLPNRQG